MIKIFFFIFWLELVNYTLFSVCNDVISLIISGIRPFFIHGGLVLFLRFGNITSFGIGFQKLNSFFDEFPRLDSHFGILLLSQGIDSDTQGTLGSQSSGYFSYFKKKYLWLLRELDSPNWLGKSIRI